jgi:hypothetical protein
MSHVLVHIYNGIIKNVTLPGYRGYYTLDTFHNFDWTLVAVVADQQQLHSNSY